MRALGYAMNKSSVFLLLKTKTAIYLGDQLRHSHTIVLMKTLVATYACYR